MDATVRLCLSGGGWKIDNCDNRYVLLERTQPLKVGEEIVLLLMMSRDEFRGLFAMFRDTVEIDPTGEGEWEEATSDVANTTHH